MSGARASRTLPGFRFETKAPPLAESLPRMDVAVFIGFAASGPLQTPVALESEAQFEALFGQDAPLAWDMERGKQIYAYLAPVVRAFFRNGGKRCWAIRVARREDAIDLNRARYNYLPIPGLARAQFNDDGSIALTPGFARARSEGSWSDSLTVGAALLSRPEQAIRGLELVQNEYVVYLVRPAAETVAAGDLLRLTFEQDGYVLFLTVSNVEPVADSPPSTPRTVRVTGSKPLWFEKLSSANLASPGSSAQVHVFTRETVTSPPADETHVVGSFETVYDATFNPDALSEKSILELRDCQPSDAPPPGAVVRADIAGRQLWMTVESLDFEASESITAVSGQPVSWLTNPPGLPLAVPSCERLTFELWVRKAEDYSVSLSDLGFEVRHSRFWGSLPTDEALYQDLLNSGGADVPATVLWRQVGDLFRFPLAGVEGSNDVYFPLAIAAVAENFLGFVKLNGSALERDGLAEFDAGLFIDRDLASVRTQILASQAEFLLYLSPNPRRLTGMHAAFALEEATIIAIPDAVHRGWCQGEKEEPPQAEESPAPVRPEWWHFADCRPRQDDTKARTLGDCDPPVKEDSKIKPVHKPPLGHFLKCSIIDVEPPRLSASTVISSNGTFTLSWESSPPFEASYVLQEATIANFDDAETIYSGQLTSFTIYGRKTGDYFYRVQATVSDNVSDWSNGVTVRVASEDRWALTKEEDYSADTLLAVQRALLRMSAARGDLFSVLTLPAEYREDKCIAHVSTLKDGLDLPATEGVAPLDAGERNDLSYGAVFHPWLINGESSQADSFRRIPPCGAVSGVFARRALTRGAWIAPANEPLRGIVALTPPISRERRWDLQDASINLVRQEPRGFIVLDADTLSDDDDLRQINVRRLLILLRRQALRLGATYVFEPHSPAFRRLVERGFTGMLDGMFVRGAFAGSSPATSYQVIADESLNTSQSVDQGRFIVELRVAPSLPLTFLTIRFIQTGDRSFVTEVR